jgi:pimeloyl-ACP methyl ester carboxylesterase
MVNYLEQNFCADTGRVFVNGYSWGGDMATALFCLRGDKIKGVSNMDGGADLQDGSAGFLFPEDACTQKHPSAWYRFAYNGWYTKEQKDYMANFYKRIFAVSDADSDPLPIGSCRQYRNTSGPLVICNEPNMGHVGLTSEELTYIWNFWKSLP